MSIQTFASNPWPITRPALQSTQSEIIIQLGSQETAGQFDRQKNEEMALSWSRILPEEIHTSRNTFVGSSLKISKILKIIGKENSDIVVGFVLLPAAITQHQLVYTVEWLPPQTQVYNPGSAQTSETQQVFTLHNVCKDDSGYGLAECCTLPNSQEATPTKNNEVHELVIG